MRKARARPGPFVCRPLTWRGRRPPCRMLPPMDAAIKTLLLRKIYPPPKTRRKSGVTPSFMGGNPAPAPGAIGPGGEIVALEALDLEVKAGEFFGLLGPNGAGKTTTIGVLTTRILPTAGRALVHGFDVAKQSVAVRRRIGVV